MDELAAKQVCRCGHAQAFHSRVEGVDHKPGITGPLAKCTLCACREFRRPSFEELLARSSLGTSDVQEAAARTPPRVVAEILRRAGQLKGDTAHDDERISCPHVGDFGHWFCGVCPEHQRPRPECGCAVRRTEDGQLVPLEGERVRLLL